MSPADIVEEVEFLTSYGLTPERVAERLGIGMSGIARACYRAGRADLGRPFGRAYKASQKVPCPDCGAERFHDPRNKRCARCAAHTRREKAAA